ncbi:Integrator complex subunit 9 [Phytophthora boehmeriae]|uniref:Integrator complex subunit 9 n=1 Tax=Phytophthora boehmeriae TaxID=109152 RepID=A0A8T1X7D8_9STRA|nr:Integrator complex subunit 9 [Phytophthora boehmeriae]
MKVIQLGGADDGLCHFLSFGGYEMLLDCGIKLQSLRREVTATGSSIFRFQLPALQSVDVEALDVVLLSNHLTMLALPLLTQVLGFKGQVYATQLTIDFGRVFLEELAALNQGEDSAVFAVEGVTDGMDAELPMFSLKEIETCCRKIQSVEYSEVVQLAYGVQVTALSSGFSLGASIWLIEGPNDRLAYVAAASGDYNRHPKELDLLPLVDCETLLLTDLKPDRDPHANTERMVERVLSNVNRVLERGGVCIIPTTPCGVLFDLIEAVYAACLHNKQNVPMYFISNHASRIMELTQLGAEWLCEKKIEKLYAGEDAFLHESLLKNNLFHAVPEISAATAATFQNGSVLFVGHSSLKFGHAPGLIRMLGNENPLVESTEAFAPFQDLNIEKIACPIDPRLSCGDANQFIARCCPQNLIIPHEYTVAPPTVGTEIVSSHFACVLPLHDLTAAKTKAELLTYPMKQFDPIVIEKASKYLDGRLDPKLAAQATITEIAGKAAACVNGVLNVKRKTFVLEAAAAASSTVCSSIDVSDDSKLKGSGKRKLASMTDSDVICESHSIDFKEKSSLLLGQVDEEKLMKQVKTHDPQAQVYISQGQGDADVFMSIPSLDARVTLWKETGKTLVETEKEDARALLTSFVLAQLVVIAQG